MKDSQLCTAKLTSPALLIVWHLLVAPQIIAQRDIHAGSLDYSLTVRDENTVSWNDNAADSSALSDLEKERSSKTPVTVGIPLTAGDRFLGEQREAIQAIIAELIARNLEPKDYIVDSTELEGKKLRVYLRNFQHASEDGRRGDSCGKCRMAYYDLQTKEVAFTGIR